MNKPLIAALTALSVLLAAPAAPAAPPDQPQPILTVDQVRVGMKGYGMTVFHGTTIEPFAVEVVSINANETPNRSVIWVRCTDERMVHTGPVQGMSGSPIYLWSDDEPRVLGEGGKLIGAFAFGYGDTNECMAGIQPIEYMRAVGQRATAADRPQLSMMAPPGAGLALMNRLSESAAALDVPELTRARLDVVRGLYQRITPGALDHERRPATMLGRPGDRGQAMRMMVPMAMGSADVAAALAPALTPLGIQPFAADPTALGGKPPAGFDVEGVELRPGSALVVPFAWGDADLSGAGTVTDVLPDGTVLGFGHAMDGVGVTAIPMATGYVHFIVSLRTISYKRSGTLDIVGALVQDEESAVAGTADRPFKTAPVHVVVNIEGQPQYTYDYEVVNHPTLTAQIAAAVVAQSTMAVQGPPTRNTTRYTTTLKFSGGRELTFESAAISAGGQAAALDISQLVGGVMQNPFEEVTLESVESTIDVDYGLDAWEITSVQLDKTTAAPGDTLTATVEMLGLFEQPITRTIRFTVPDDLPDGETQVMIGDAAMYTQMMMAGNPAIAQVDTVDELIAALGKINGVSPTTLFAVVPTRRVGVAVDGQDLANLPSSRAAILAGNNPKAQQYQALDTTAVEMDRIILGNAQLKLNIKKPVGAR